MSCKLIESYERNIRKYFLWKHEKSKKSNDARKNRVKVFLKFCCKYGVKEIKNIGQVEYDRFMQGLSNRGYSIETRRKYMLALREFFQRAHLNIKVNIQCATTNAKLKKFERLKQITGCECLEQFRDKIVEIL